MTVKSPLRATGRAASYNHLPTMTEAGFTHLHISKGKGLDGCGLRPGSSGDGEAGGGHRRQQKRRQATTAMHCGEPPLVWEQREERERRLQRSPTLVPPRRAGMGVAAVPDRWEIR